MILQHEELTGSIINAFFKVYNTLGYGFLEKVYENALLLELRARGFHCLSQYPVKVFYDNIEVGFYIADIIVNDILIIEIKAAEGLCEQHEFQLINYLRATDLQIGLLLNFGKSPQFKRKIVSRVLNKSQFNTST
ncbi:MAG: GxxExxY protein [Bacteroidetes bacterium]|nr:GxxExxY protein [Bacteroidota bacterium]